MCNKFVKIENWDDIRRKNKEVGTKYLWLYKENKIYLITIGIKQFESRYSEFCRDQQR